MEQKSTLDSNYCYTVFWNMSPESIRRLFLHEPRTLIFRIHVTGRRMYQNIRIPGTVALPIKNRMSVVA